MTHGWDAYDRDADALAAQYDSLTFAQVHAPLLGLLPAAPGLVLDVGAGSGRDARGLAERGHQVVAVEPSAGLRAHGERASDPAIRWIADALPDLAWVSRAGLAFDFILLAGVWMHIAPGDRARAFRKLAGLLAPGGRIAFSLRRGPEPPGRGFHPVSAEELEAFAAAHGLAFLLRAEQEDTLGREGVRWTNLVFQRPDQGQPHVPVQP